MNLSSRFYAYLFAIIGFIVMMFIYFYPALEGKVVKQQDIIRSRATSQEIYKHRDKYGEEPLWTNSQFSGMPTFQMSTRYPGNLIEDVKMYLTKPYFPASLGLIFTLFIGFFFLLSVMRVNPWLALIGAFAYTFSSYFIISFEAGHTGKLRVLGFVAPSIASMIIAFRGKWLLGGALTAFTVGAALASNHLQISYYLALLICIIMVVEGISAVKKGLLKPYMMTTGILLIAGILAIGPNVSSIWSTYTFSQETIRGGASPLSKSEENQSSGLDKDYAMRWSYGKMETFNLLIPNLYGGASQQGLGVNSNTGEALQQKGMSQGRVKQILQNMPLYWGDQPFTSGPNYIGAVICFLFVVGLFLVQKTVRWWVIAATALAIMLAWGRHFPLLNDFMFEHFPFYNKFRAPSMILTIVCLTAPFMGILGLDQVMKNQGFNKTTLKKVQYALYITGGLCLLFLLFGEAMFDFQGRSDSRLAQQGFPMDALRDDRADLLRTSSLRSLIFILLTFLLIWGYLKKKLSGTILIAGIGLLVVVDLWVVDKRYLNESHFTRNKDYENYYSTTRADQKIMNDNDPHFRVFNLATQDPFTDALTSYHHKSIGGYDAAKLIRYQDLIERQLRNNRSVLNMLNTKWLIMTAKNKQGQQEVARRNPRALGNAWFVDSLKWVDTPDQAMNSLNDFKPAQTAIINKEFMDYMENYSNPTRHPESSISLANYKANELTYDVTVKNGPHFAVFSEVYYEGGNDDWKVYIDGKEKSHIRVNYTLRGMMLPKGDYTLTFKFHPRSYYSGEKISLASSIIIFLLLLIGGWYEYKRRNDQKEEQEKIALED